MLLIPTEVRPSSIHGLGLFTLVPVKAGTLIAHWSLGFDRLFISEYHIIYPDRIATDFIKHYGYQDKGDGHWHLCTDNLRFMNHADDPNTRQDIENDYAVRDIEAGEELTCNYYAFDMDAERKLQHEAPVP